MPRTKGSKNKPKTVTADFATQLTEKQSAREALAAEIASMQLKKFHQNQIEVNPFGCRDLRSVQPALCHLIDFITVQHQV